MPVIGAVVDAICETSWRWYDFVVFGAGLTVLLIFIGRIIIAIRNRMP